jgi:hypothetical protein
LPCPTLSLSCFKHASLRTALRVRLLALPMFSRVGAAFHHYFHCWC